MKKLVLTGLMLALSLPVLSIKALAASEIGTTVVAKGMVVARTASNASERVLARREHIYENDRINTGADARAVFKLTDDTVITLGEQADMAVADYQFDESDKRLLIEIATGAFRVVTGKLTRTDQPNFTVVSKRSTIAVRGTDFWGGSLHGPDSLDVALLEGEHALVVSNDFGTVEITVPGFGTTIYPGKAPSEPELWPASMVQKAVETISY